MSCFVIEFGNVYINAYLHAQLQASISHEHINPYTTGFSDALYSASEKTSYQITHTTYLLETIHKIIPYRLGKPITFLD